MRKFLFLGAAMVAVAALFGASGCGEKTVEKPVEVKVGEWGPQETTVGKPFNLQPDGKSSFFVRVTGLNIGSGVQVLFGDKELENPVVSDKLVAAAVPNSLIEQPGDRAIVLVEGATKRRVTVGTFKVLPK